MTPISYPYDETGVASTNLVKGEEHITTYLNSNSYYLLVPKFGPFFINNFNLQFMDSITGRPLKEGVDYEFVLPWNELSQAINQMVYAGVLILDVTLVGRIQITYQSIGGVFSVDADYVLKFFAEKVYNPREIEFSKITNLQAEFPPSKHLQKVDTFFNYTALANAIEELATLIKNGQSSTDIGQHILNTNNPHKDTAVMLGIDQVVNKPTATDAEVQAMSFLDHYLLLSQALAIKQKVTSTVVVTEGPTLMIPPFIYEQQTVQIPITNFNSWNTYTITVSSGTVTLNQTTGVITYTGPAFTGPNSISVSAAASGGPYPDQAYGNVKFTVNDTSFYLKVYKWEPDAPTLTVARSYKDLVAVGSAFNVPESNDTQKSASWELAYDQLFTRLVASSENDTTNLTTWTLPQGLTVGNTYYIRAKYTGNITGDSPWSDTFTLIAPDLTVDSVPIAEMQMISSINGYEVVNTVISADAQTLVMFNDEQKVVVYQLDPSTGTFSSLQTLDPVPQPNGQAPFSGYGASAAISGDSSILLVGTQQYTSSGDGFYVPGVHVYKRGTDNKFALIQTIVLEKTDSFYTDTTNINHDGSVVIAGPKVYTLVNGAYSLNQVINDPSPGDSGEYTFGDPCAVSADGTVIAIGKVSYMPADDARIFIFRGTPATGYTLSETIRPQAGTGYYTSWGTRISLSGDGNTIAIGDPDGNTSNPYLTVPAADKNGTFNSGIVEVFSYQGGNWVYEAGLIGRENIIQPEYFAKDFVLTHSGNSLFVGSTFYDGVATAFYYADIYTYVRVQQVDGTRVWKRVQKTYPSLTANEYGYNFLDRQIGVSAKGEYLVYCSNSQDYGAGSSPDPTVTMMPTGIYIKKPTLDDIVLSSKDAPLDYTWK